MEKADLARTQRAARILVQEGQNVFPLRFPVDRFRLQRFVAGLTSRIVGTADAATLLSELDRRADLAILVRSLYEHVLTLAWLTGDKSDTYARMLLLQRADDETALKVDRETVTILHGYPLMAPELRRQIESDLAATKGGPQLPNLAERAVIVDREWQGLVGFVGSSEQPKVSLRGLYTSLYRPMSGVVHPSRIGMTFVQTEGDRDGTVLIGLERQGEAGPTLGGAIGLLGAALIVSNQVIDRPRLATLEPAIDAALSELDA